MVKKKRERKEETGRLSPGIWMLGGLALIMTFLVYHSSLKNDFVNWDDPAYIMGNPHFKDFSIIKVFQSYDVGNYHPFTIISLYIDYQLSMSDVNDPSLLKPYYFHLHNLLLHLAGVMLVLGFAYFLLGKKGGAAFFVALLYGIHPMHVESVAWISERKDVLYAMYFFASLLCYMLYREHGQKKWYYWSLFFFLFSLFSKGQAVTLSLVIVLIDIYQRREINKSFFIEKLPYLGLSFMFGLIAINAQQTGGGSGQVDISFFDSFLVGFFGIMMYVYKFFCPVNLACFHPYIFNEHGELPAIVNYSILIVIGIGTVIYFLSRKDRAVWFGPLFFLVTIFPVLQFFPVGRQIIAERYTLIPYVGLSIFFIHLVQKLLEIPTCKKHYKTVYAGLGGFILVLSVQAHNQAKIWENTETLWSQVLELYPNTTEAYINRGYWYNQVKRYDEGIADASKGLEIDSTNFKLWINRGVAFERKGFYKKAVADYTMSLNCNDTNVKALMNRGIIYVDHLNKLELGAKDFLKVLEINPSHIDAIQNLGVVYFKMNMFEKALEYLSKAEKIDESNGRTNQLKAFTYAAIKDYKMALEEAAKARENGLILNHDLVKQWNVLARK